MMKRRLRWRDGYSMNMQALRPGTNDAKAFARPLPVNELITEVKTRGLRDTVWEDSTETFVELGLFYTKPGAGDNSVSDTNYVMVLNRRSFERPADIDSTSARGRLMDSLAETRVIRIKLNLMNSDSTPQYNFVRIRELTPDVTRLPLTDGPRSPLDTCILGDSAFTLVLGSGRAALLEIRYLPPLLPLYNIYGDMGFNLNRRRLAAPAVQHSSSGIHSR